MDTAMKAVITRMSQRNGHDFAQRLRQQDVVAEFGERALKATDFPGLMNEAVHLISKALSVEYCKILQLLPDGQSLLLKAGVGWNHGAVGCAQVSAGPNSQAGYTLLADRPIIVEDLRTEKRFAGPPLLLDHGVVSGLSVIIHGTDRPYGVLGAHTKERRGFSKHDVSFLQGMANMISAAVKRQQVEADLRAKQLELTDFVENAAIGMHWVGEDGTVQWVNQAELDLLGYTRQEYIGQHISKFHADPEVIKDILKCLADGQELHSYEARLLCKDGSIKHVLITSNVYWRDGKFIHTRCFTRDNTERKLAEQALQASESKFRELLDNLPAAAYTCDRDGLITYYNRHALEIWGRAPKLNDEQDRFCGSFKLFWSDGSPMRHDQCWMAEALKTQSSYQGQDVIIERADGKRVFALANAHPIQDESGELTGAVNILVDISEQKQREEELHRTLREKEVLLKEVHHRVKNNMQVVSCLLNIQARNHHDEPTKQLLQECSSRIRAMMLIHEKLYQSQNLAEVDFKSYLRNLLRNLFQSYQAKPGIRYKLEVNGMALSVNSAIPCGLIVNELVTNSLKYAFPNDAPGTVHVGLSQAPDGQNVLLVRDDGCGFQEEVDIETADTVGLSLVKSLVEQLAGKLEMQNGKGTEFRIRFPAR